MIPTDHILSPMSEIAKNAGSILMEYFNTGAEVQHKADGSPVTLADQNAEKYIIDELTKLFPDIPAIGEESAKTGVDLTSMQRYWMIDPLDGTKDFIRNSPQFTVNIALVERGVPITGVIHAPAMDLTYAGDKEMGSFRLSSNAAVKLRGERGDRPFTITISRLHPGGPEEEYLKRLSELFPVDVLHMSSSLKFCLLAEGRADMYFRAGRTMHWDTAAGHIIATGAGAKVVAWETKKELTYLNRNLENPSFMVYNIERTPEEILNI